MSNNQNNPQEVPQIKSVEEIVILKKDWPPFPKGTEFKIKQGCADKMLVSPSFGDVMPNGQKSNGMIPRTWSEYIRHFDHVGGFDAWFDKKYKTEEERLKSRIEELEKQNAMYKEALKEINEIVCDVRISSQPKVYSVIRLAEQALNPKDK